MMLTQLADVARRTGYPVVEVSGWKTRGRPGGMLDVRTITCHHTANGGAKGNYPSLRVVRDGRSGLPGPLAQYGLGRDGTIYVIAAGKCNHAGVSRATAYTNPHAIGIEAEAVGVPGTPGDWPAKQMDAYHRLCLALVNEFGAVEINDVRGHKETCSPVGRKSDPSFSMDKFRADVRALKSVRKPSAPAKPPAKETDMAQLDWYDKVIPLTKTDAAVWTQHVKAEGGTDTFEKGHLVSFADYVKYPTLARKIHIRQLQGEERIKDLGTELGELRTAVAELSALILERLPAPPAPGQ